MTPLLYWSHWANGRLYHSEKHRHHIATPLLDHLAAMGPSRRPWSGSRRVRGHPGIRRGPRRGLPHLPPTANLYHPQQRHQRVPLAPGLAATVHPALLGRPRSGAGGVRARQQAHPTRTVGALFGLLGRHQAGIAHRTCRRLHHTFGPYTSMPDAGKALRGRRRGGRGRQPKLLGRPATPRPAFHEADAQRATVA